MVAPRALLATSLFALLVLGNGSTARAGARPYGYLSGTSSLHEGGLEIENWLGHERGSGMESARWDWWTGPVAGITDRWESGLFLIGTQAAEQGSGLQLREIRWQVDYLLADRGAWPIDVR